MAFIPPFPTPHKSKSSFLLRFLRGWRSWLDVLFERSYRMKMGEIWQPGFNIYMVNEPGWVRRILIEKAKDYPKHELMHRMLEPLLGVSIFTTNGEVWERQRRLVDQAFEQARLKLVFPLMLDSVDDMLARLDAQADGQPYEVDAEMTYVTADIIFRTILSEKLTGQDARDIYDAFVEFQRHAQRAMMLMIYRLPSFFARRASEKSAKRIRAILARLIAARYAARERGEDHAQDILSALMDARDPVAGDGFSYEEMVDQVCMLFLAGHETSASALGWSLYLMSQCPDLQERMLAEIGTEIGERPFAFGDAKRLPLTRDVFREALRLYPPVGFFVREAAQTHCIRKKTVKAGSPILVAPWLIHRHRDLWERPDEFDPDRFETESGKSSLKCAYIPFSNGPRVCPGAAFATQEAMLILAGVVRRFRVGAVPDRTPKPVGRVTIRSDNGIWIRLTRRTPVAGPQQPAASAGRCPAHS